MLVLAADSDLPAYSDFFLRLFIDLVALAALGGLMYFRRHGRRDMVFAFTTFNLGVFVVLSAISAQHIGAAVGFGLFAVLSIIRLRSEPFDFLELGYFFSALVLSVANGLDLTDTKFTLVLNVIILGSVFFLDNGVFHTGLRRRRVTLDRIETDAAALRERLAIEQDLEIVDLTISEIDYVRESTDVSLRFVDRSRRKLGSRG